MTRIGDIVNKILINHFFMDDDKIVPEYHKTDVSSNIFKSGLKALDDIMVEFSPGGLYVIGSVAGMGKTSLMLDIALHTAKNENIPVHIFSFEMSAEQLVLHLISKYTDLPWRKVLKGDSDCKPVLEKCRKELINLPIYICDEVITADEMKKIVCDECTSGIVFIDYFQLVVAAVERYSINNNVYCTNSTLQRKDEIIADLKVIVQEYNAPIVVLSQLSNQLKLRSDKRPVLRDIGYNGRIDQAADGVIFIYRDSYYNCYNSTKENCKTEVAELIVAKNKRADTGTAVVQFDRSTLSFRC